MSGKHTVVVHPKCLGEMQNKKGETVRLGYHGSVTMRVPTWLEKRDLLQGFGVTTAEEITAAMENTGETYRKMTAYLVTKVAPFVAAVDIIREEDGLVITDWEDIHYEGALAASLVSEMAWWVVNGKHRLPGPSSPS